MNNRLNSTILKFGHPATTVAEYEHWIVMLRQKQITAGSLVLACREEATSFSALPGEAFAELKLVTIDLEASLRELVRYERLNYIALMMVDPHFHFHVIPRYPGSRELAGVEITDLHWPGPPDFRSTAPVADADIARMCELVKLRWQKSS